MLHFIRAEQLDTHHTWEIKADGQPVDLMMTKSAKANINHTYAKDGKKWELKHLHCTLKQKQE